MHVAKINRETTKKKSAKFRVHSSNNNREKRVDQHRQSVVLRRVADGEFSLGMMLAAG